MFQVCFFSDIYAPVQICEERQVTNYEETTAACLFLEPLSARSLTEVRAAPRAMGQHS